MGEPDDSAVSHLIAKMPVQRLAQGAVAGHVDIGDRRVRRQRRDAVIAHDLIVAAERLHEGGI